MGLTKQLGYDQQGRLTSVTLPPIPNPDCGSPADPCVPADFVNPPPVSPRYEYGYFCKEQAPIGVKFGIFGTVGSGSVSAAPVVLGCRSGWRNDGTDRSMGNCVVV
jgi:hypothetical protein